MVGHESVDPKPQEKSVLVYRCDLLLVNLTVQVYERHRWVKAKGNPVLIPEPGCGYVRSETPVSIRSR